MVSGASLAFFRFAFGFLLALHFIRQAFSGQLWSTYQQASDLLPYLGFESWPVPPLSKLVHLVALLTVSGFMIAIGFWLRAALLFFILAFGYLLVLDEAEYQNHYYLMLLIAGILLFTRAGDVYSLDNRLRRMPQNQPVPAEDYWWLRLQLGMVYFFGGIAKLNPDWLRGEPMREWLGGSALALPMSYGGLLFDLLIAPALLWRRTRVVAVVTALIFHSINSQLFRIGVFPYLAFAATLLFLAPNWPERFIALIRRTKRPPPESVPWRWSRLMAAWLAVQVLLPLRHWLYPGDVCWNMEGQKFSWMMKLHTRTGEGKFIVRTDKAEIPVDPHDLLDIHHGNQVRVLPEHIVKFARRLRLDYERQGHKVQAVTGDLYLTLNDHPKRRYVDAEVDLSRVKFGPFSHATWVLPGPHDD